LVLKSKAFWFSLWRSEILLAVVVRGFAAEGSGAKDSM
jgi:hypothetical protein